MIISSRRSRARQTRLEWLGRLAVLGGGVCAVLVSRSPWWAIGAAVLIGLGLWLTIAEIRARRDLEADEALEAAAEYDRVHPGDGRSGSEGPDRSR